jgi:hypothetical protein
MVEFPVIFMWKDTGRLQCAHNLDALLYLIEPNDVEFEELVMWDKTGRVLNYGNDSSGKLWLNPSDSFDPNLTAEIRKELARRNLQTSLADERPLTSVLELLKKGR